MKSPAADALTEILETFDITATYDKPNRALALSATLKPELTAAALNANRPPQGRSGQSPNSGDNLRTETFGL
jgi:hypothetical protein